MDEKRAAEIDTAIAGAVGDAVGDDDGGTEAQIDRPESRRVGNTRFFWNDGVGGMAKITHDELPLTIRARPREVSVYSRVEGADISVDHKPEADGRGAEPKAPPSPSPSAGGSGDPPIYGKISEALEGVESVEDLSSPAQQVVDHIDMSHFRDRLEGRDGGLRPSKPDAQGDTGLVQYVWRMARFHAGADPEMPVTASWWLQDWLDDQGIEASVSGVTDTEGQQITGILDVIARMLVASFGQDPGAGAERWEGVLFGGSGEE